MNHTTTPIRRLGLAVTGIVALAAGGVVVLGADGIGERSHGRRRPHADPDGQPGDPSPPPDLSLDDLLLSDDDDDDGPTLQVPIDLGPVMTIPMAPGDDDDDDGPILQGPIDVGPLVTIPRRPATTMPDDDPPALGSALGGSDRDDPATRGAARCTDDDGPERDRQPADHSAPGARRRRPPWPRSSG